MSCSTGSTIARASSGSRSRINSVEPLMSANSAVTVLRSPSIVDEASGCSGVTRISEAVNPAGEPVVAGAAIPASAAPQSSQKADDGAFSAPHFEQRLDRGLPHAAQNFLLVVLSVPHLLQRIALLGKPSDSLFLYHPACSRALKRRIPAAARSRAEFLAPRPAAWGFSHAPGPSRSVPAGAETLQPNVCKRVPALEKPRCQGTVAHRQARSTPCRRFPIDGRAPRISPARKSPAPTGSPSRTRSC